MKHKCIIKNNEQLRILHLQVPESRNLVRNDLRDPGGPLELRLHPRGALLEETPLPRAVRGRPAGQDLRGAWDSLGGGVARKLIRGEAA